MRSLALLAALVGVMPAAGQEKRTMTVGQLFELVESNSKTLRQQKTSVEFASKGIDAARSQRLPDINTSLSVSYNGNVVTADRDFSDLHGYSAPHLGNSFALEAQQVVYSGGALTAGIRMAELRHEQAQAGEQQTRADQRFMALGHYLDLCKTDHRMQVYQQHIDLAHRIIDQVRARHEAGMALSNDITRHELQLAQLQLALRKLEDHRATTNYELCHTLGLPLTTLITPDTVVTDTLRPDTDEALWQQQALATSPAYRQASLGVRLAGEELKMARSALRPTVALVAADNLMGPFNYDIPPKDINYNYWFVGLGVKYTVSSLFKQNRKVEQARLAARRSEEQRDVTAQQLNTAVQSACTLYRQSHVELETQRKSVALARQNYDVVSHRYLAQLALITDMLDAATIRLDAELQEADARINTLYAYYKMKYISGTL